MDDERQEIMDGAIKAIDSDLTDLHRAAKSSKYTLTCALIMGCVDLSAQSCFSRTALHFAAMSIRKNSYSPIICQILICEGIFIFIMGPISNFNQSNLFTIPPF